MTTNTLTIGAGRDFMPRTARGASVKQLPKRNKKQAVIWAYGDRAPLVANRLVISIKDWRRTPAYPDSKTRAREREFNIFKLEHIEAYVERHRESKDHTVYVEQGHDEDFTRYEIVRKEEVS